MANSEDLDLDVEKEVEPEAKKPPLKLIIIIVSALLVLSGGTVGALYFLGVFGGDEPAATAEAAADGEAGKEGEAKQGKDGKAEKAAKVPATPPVFMALDPPFVVNFSEAETTRFLQISIDVSTRDNAVLDAIRANMPMIRNNLVLLFSSQKAADLISREGKEKLRQEALAEVQKVLTEQTGKPGVDNVYFTSFVMQ